MAAAKITVVTSDGTSTFDSFAAFLRKPNRLRNGKRLLEILTIMENRDEEIKLLNDIVALGARTRQLVRGVIADNMLAKSLDAAATHESTRLDALKKANPKAKPKKTLRIADAMLTFATYVSELNELGGELAKKLATIKNDRVYKDVIVLLKRVLHNEGCAIQSEMNATADKPAFDLAAVDADATFYAFRERSRVVCVAVQGGRMASVCMHKYEKDEDGMKYENEMTRHWIAAHLVSALKRLKRGRHPRITAVPEGADAVAIRELVRRA